jgi:BirA family transcriptional regulator, biotin operon repressor / biotin---[acetyl-CoA-carboxylase] ligase
MSRDRIFPERCIPVSPIDPEAGFHRFTSITSTMDEAARLAADGAPHGTVVTAEYQTAGRGRFGSRTWQAAPGSAVLVTVILDPECIGMALPGALSRERAPLSLLPLVLGCGVAETLERGWNLDAAVKWPNDVMVRRRKIAGILCEHRYGKVCAGIGLNCTSDSVPAGLSSAATAIELEQTAPAPPEEVLKLLLGSVQRLFPVCINGKSEQDVRDSIHRRLLYRGMNVSYRIPVPGGIETVQGRVAGIDNDGALLLSGSRGAYRIIAGELLSVIPDG